MLNRTLILVAILISGIVLSSCSSKFSLTKRRYTKGYYFDVAKNKKAVKGKVAEADNETTATKSPQNNPENTIQQSPETVASSQTVYDNGTGEQVLAIVPKKETGKKHNSINYPKSHINTSFQKAGHIKNISAKTEKNNSEAPYELLASGTGVLAYIVGAFLSIIFSFLFFFLIFAIIDGLFPIWLISFLVFLLVIAVIAIIVVVIINSD